MHEKRRAPTDDYILRTDSPGTFRFSAPPKGGVEEFEPAEVSISQSLCYEFVQFATPPNYQHREPCNAQNCVTNQNFKAYSQPPQNEPPPYCFQPSTNSLVQPQSPEVGSKQEPRNSDSPQKNHVHSSHFTRFPDTFADNRPYPITFENWRDFRVLPVKLADDPGRNDGEGDDRHWERPHDDRRPAPLPPFNAGALASAPYPQQHPYQSYPPHSGYPQPSFPPPLGYGAFERSGSPQHNRYPPMPTYPTGYPPQPSPYPPMGLPLPGPPYPVPNASSSSRLPTSPPRQRQGDPYLPFKYPESRPPFPIPLPGYPPNLPGNPQPIHGHPPYPHPLPYQRPRTPQPPNIPGIAPPAPMFGPPAVTPSYLQTHGPRAFELRVRQQPERARMCGFGEKDRRPVDPCPIVEVLEGTEKLTSSVVKSLVVQCTLWNEDGTQHRNIIRTVGPAPGLGTAEELPAQPEEKHARVMMGDIFANALYLEDEHGERGYFCIFSDLSIRVEGIYRLRFDLLRVSIPPQTVAGPNHIIASALSDRFQVFPAKKFGGMQPATPLIKAFAKQGVKIRNRPENKKKNQKEQEVETETLVSPSTDTLALRTETAGSRTETLISRE